MLPSLHLQLIHTQYYNSPFGELVLGSFKDELCICDWRFRKNRASVDKRVLKFCHASFKEESSDTIEKAIKQLNEYFNSIRTSFDIPLLLAGSEFQQSVWKGLLQIEYGKTTSYKKLSTKLDNALAIRAVATANGANALSIFIPCHRVIGTNGKMVGYAGGIAVKRKLLQLEGSHAQLTLF